MSVSVNARCQTQAAPLLICGTQGFRGGGSWNQRIITNIIALLLSSPAGAAAQTVCRFHQRKLNNRAAQIFQPMALKGARATREEGKSHESIAAGQTALKRYAQMLTLGLCPANPTNPRMRRSLPRHNYVDARV